MGVVYFIVTLIVDQLMTGGADFCMVIFALLNPWSFLFDILGLYNSIWNDHIVDSACASDIIMSIIWILPINFIIGATLGVLYRKIKNKTQSA